MTNGAAAAAIANAIRASGVLVRMEPREFLSVLSRCESPLVVIAECGVFSRKYQYLTSYKGLAFYTKSSTPLPIGGHAEVISAKKIVIPG